LRWASKAWYLSETWLWNDPPRLAVLILWDEPQNPGSQEIVGRYCRYIQQKAILNCSAYKPTETYSKSIINLHFCCWIPYVVRFNLKFPGTHRW
jgi:hypothetical protein